MRPAITLGKCSNHRQNQKITESFKICSKPIWFHWLIHLLLTFYSTTWSRPSYIFIFFGKVEVFICNQILHSKLCLCFHNRRLDFTAYTSSCLIHCKPCQKYVIKMFQVKNVKNLETVYLKWRTEWKCSWKRGLHLKNGYLCLTKGYLVNIEGQVEVEFPP